MFFGLKKNNYLQLAAEENIQISNCETREVSTKRCRQRASAAMEMARLTRLLLQWMIIILWERVRSRPLPALLSFTSLSLYTETRIICVAGSVKYNQLVNSACLFVLIKDTKTALFYINLQLFSSKKCF